jgi:CBS domain-containing protein
MSKVRDYMSTHVQTADANAELSTIAQLMKKEDVGFIPLVEEKEYVGIITDRDIVVKGLAEGDVEQKKASDIMTKEVVTATPDTAIEEAARIMQEHQVRRLLVVDEGKINGVVSLGDFGVENAADIAGEIVRETSKGKGNN